MEFGLLRDNIKQEKTEITTHCLTKTLFSRAQHGAAGWRFLSSQPTFSSCFITSQKQLIRAKPWLLLSRKPDRRPRPFRGGSLLVADANTIYPAVKDSYRPRSSRAAA